LQFTFDVGVYLACGGYDGIDKEEFVNAYHKLESGYNSLPLNLPGMSFNKSMKVGYDGNARPVHFASLHVPGEELVEV
jgi:hypothetical protein